ncbi:MAG: penicillin-binding protein [Alphaproteobacteria bacterium]|nr:penicillin-binding protein [Alphaproteobacteria bacterium]
MQDPFYAKKKQKKGRTRLLEADALIDSSLYDFFASLSDNYTSVQDFMDRFRVTGIRRFFVEMVSDGLSFLAIGLVLMTALALPAFDVTASGEINKAEDYAIIFLDRYGNEIGRRGIRADDSVTLDQIPEVLKQATLATEDQHFYEHFGIDIAGTLRALVTNASGDSSLQGGSSITQQLAKNLFLSSERTIERKIKEAFLSIWLETHYTKDEILKLYFDRAYMGGGNFGVTAAAEFYFGKSVKDVDLAESAMLAGLFKAPTRYAPHVDLAAARGRANVVLSRMVDAGYFTEGQVAVARRNPATPIDQSAQINSPNYFLDWVFEETKKIVAGRDDVGFIVRTTIDPTLQSYAEEAVTSIIRENGERYDVSQAAMVVAEPNGAVRAMVGGLDYGESQYNRAIVSARQPGSSFKPFVYATALEMLDLTPDSLITDRPVCIGNWCPQNYGHSYAGTVTILSAFSRSINTVPVTLSTKTGRQPIADMAHRLGISNDFPVTRSLPLGVVSVSVLDMTSAYSSFASGGYKTPGVGIIRITTLRGEPVFEHDLGAARERVLSEDVVANMNMMMRNVVTSGTGTRAKVEGVPAAGKTGTTSSYRDAWFCGFTGNYVAAVWFGNDDYHPMARVTGGALPAMTWQKFMAFAHSNIEIKPVFGVDFTPEPYKPVVETAEAGEEVVTRPPTLQPDAADKLEDLSALFRRAAIAASAQPQMRASFSPPAER